MVEANAPQAAERTGEETWISLASARQMLGVNESTLRRWADQGQIRSFRTPGGHRRFSESDIRALIAGATRGMPAADHYHELSNMAVARIRRRLQHARGPEPEWAAGIDEAGRVHLRQTGRRLISLTSEYLARPRARTRLLEEARGIGGEYGVQLARSGLPLREAVTAFTFFRRSLEETAKQVAQKENLSPEEASQTWGLINALGDEVLIALTDAYESTRSRGE